MNDSTKTEKQNYIEQLCNENAENLLFGQIGATEVISGENQRQDYEHTREQESSAISQNHVQKSEPSKTCVTYCAEAESSYQISHSMNQDAKDFSTHSNIQPRSSKTSIPDILGDHSPILSDPEDSLKLGNDDLQAKIHISKLGSVSGENVTLENIPEDHHLISSSAPGSVVFSSATKSINAASQVGTVNLETSDQCISDTVDSKSLAAHFEKEQVKFDNSSAAVHSAVSMEEGHTGVKVVKERKVVNVSQGVQRITRTIMKGQSFQEVSEVEPISNVISIEEMSSGGESPVTDIKVLIEEADDDDITAGSTKEIEFDQPNEQIDTRDVIGAESKLLEQLQANVLGSVISTESGKRIVSTKESVIKSSKETSVTRKILISTTKIQHKMQSSSSTAYRTDVETFIPDPLESYSVSAPDSTQIMEDNQNTSMQSYRSQDIDDEQMEPSKVGSVQKSKKIVESYAQSHCFSKAAFEEQTSVSSEVFRDTQQTTELESKATSFYQSQSEEIKMGDENIVQSTLFDDSALYSGFKLPISVEAKAVLQQTEGSDIIYPDEHQNEMLDHNLPFGAARSFPEKASGFEAFGSNTKSDLSVYDEDLSVTQPSGSVVNTLPTSQISEVEAAGVCEERVGESEVIEMGLDAISQLEQNIDDEQDSITSSFETKIETRERRTASDTIVLEMACDTLNTDFYVPEDLLSEQQRKEIAMTLGTFDKDQVTVESLEDYGKQVVEISSISTTKESPSVLPELEIESAIEVAPLVYNQSEQDVEQPSENESSQVMVTEKFEEARSTEISHKKSLVHTKKQEDETAKYFNVEISTDVTGKYSSTDSPHSPEPAVCAEEEQMNFVCKSAKSFDTSGEETVLISEISSSDEVILGFDEDDKSRKSSVIKVEPDTRLASEEVTSESQDKILSENESISDITGKETVVSEQPLHDVSYSDKGNAKNKIEMEEHKVYTSDDATTTLEKEKKVQSEGKDTVDITSERTVLTKKKKGKSKKKKKTKEGLGMQKIEVGVTEEIHSDYTDDADKEKHRADEHTDSKKEYITEIEEYEEKDVENVGLELSCQQLERKELTPSSQEGKKKKKKKTKEELGMQKMEVGVTEEIHSDYTDEVDKEKHQADEHTVSKEITITEVEEHEEKDAVELSCQQLDPKELTASSQKKKKKTKEDLGMQKMEVVVKEEIHSDYTDVKEKHQADEHADSKEKSITEVEEHDVENVSLELSSQQLDTKELTASSQKGKKKKKKKNKKKQMENDSKEPILTQGIVEVRQDQPSSQCDVNVEKTKLAGDRSGIYDKEGENGDISKLELAVSKRHDIDQENKAVEKGENIYDASDNENMTELSEKTDLTECDSVHVSDKCPKSSVSSTTEEIEIKVDVKEIVDSNIVISPETGIITSLPDDQKNNGATSEIQKEGLDDLQVELTNITLIKDVDIDIGPDKQDSCSSAIQDVPDSADVSEISDYPKSEAQVLVLSEIGTLKTSVADVEKTETEEAEESVPLDQEQATAESFEVSEPAQDVTDSSHSASKVISDYDKPEPEGLVIHDIDASKVSVIEKTEIKEAEESVPSDQEQATAESFEEFEPAQDVTDSSHGVSEVISDYDKSEPESLATHDIDASKVSVTEKTEIIEAEESVPLDQEQATAESFEVSDPAQDVTDSSHRVSEVISDYDKPEPEGLVTHDIDASKVSVTEKTEIIEAEESVPLDQEQATAESFEVSEPAQDVTVSSHSVSEVISDYDKSEPEGLLIHDIDATKVSVTEKTEIKEAEESVPSDQEQATAESFEELEPAQNVTDSSHGVSEVISDYDKPEPESLVTHDIDASKVSVTEKTGIKEAEESVPLGQEQATAESFEVSEPAQDVTVSSHSVSEVISDYDKSEPEGLLMHDIDATKVSVTEKTEIKEAEESVPSDQEQATAESFEELEPAQDVTDSSHGVSEVISDYDKSEPESLVTHDIDASKVSVTEKTEIIEAEESVPLGQEQATAESFEVSEPAEDVTNSSHSVLEVISDYDKSEPEGLVIHDVEASKVSVTERREMKEAEESVPLDQEQATIESTEILKSASVAEHVNVAENMQVPKKKKKRNKTKRRSELQDMKETQAVISPVVKPSDQLKDMVSTGNEETSKQECFQISEEIRLGIDVKTGTEKSEASLENIEQKEKQHSEMKKAIVSDVSDNIQNTLPPSKAPATQPVEQDPKYNDSIVPVYTESLPESMEPDDIKSIEVSDSTDHKHETDDAAENAVSHVLDSQDTEPNSKTPKKKKKQKCSKKQKSVRQVDQMPEAAQKTQPDLPHMEQAFLEALTSSESPQKEDALAELKIDSDFKPTEEIQPTTEASRSMIDPSEVDKLKRGQRKKKKRSKLNLAKGSELLPEKLDETRDAAMIHKDDDSAFLNTEDKSVDLVSQSVSITREIEHEQTQVSTDSAQTHSMTTPSESKDHDSDTLSDNNQLPEIPTEKETKVKEYREDSLQSSTDIEDSILKIADQESSKENQSNLFKDQVSAVVTAVEDLVSSLHLTDSRKETSQQDQQLSVPAQSDDACISSLNKVDQSHGLSIIEREMAVEDPNAIQTVSELSDEKLSSPAFDLVQPEVQGNAKIEELKHATDIALSQVIGNFENENFIYEHKQTEQRIEKVEESTECAEEESNKGDFAEYLSDQSSDSDQSDMQAQKQSAIASWDEIDFLSGHHYAKLHEKQFSKETQDEKDWREYISDSDESAASNQDIEISSKASPEFVSIFEPSAPSLEEVLASESQPEQDNYTDVKNKASLLVEHVIQLALHKTGQAAARENTYSEVSNASENGSMLQIHSSDSLEEVNAELSHHISDQETVQVEETEIEEWKNEDDVKREDQSTVKSPVDSVNISLDADTHTESTDEQEIITVMTPGNQQIFKSTESISPTMSPLSLEEQHLHDMGLRSSDGLSSPDSRNEPPGTPDSGIATQGVTPVDDRRVTMRDETKSGMDSSFHEATGMFLEETIEELTDKEASSCEQFACKEKYSDWNLAHQSELTDLTETEAIFPEISVTVQEKETIQTSAETFIGDDLIQDESADNSVQYVQITGEAQQYKDDFNEVELFHEDRKILQEIEDWCKDAKAIVETSVPEYANKDILNIELQELMELQYECPEKKKNIEKIMEYLSSLIDQSNVSSREALSNVQSINETVKYIETMIEEKQVNLCLAMQNAEEREEKYKMLLASVSSGIDDPEVAEASLTSEWVQQNHNLYTTVHIQEQILWSLKKIVYHYITHELQQTGIQRRLSTSVQHQLSRMMHHFSYQNWSTSLSTVLTPKICHNQKFLDAVQNENRTPQSMQDELSFYSQLVRSNINKLHHITRDENEDQEVLVVRIIEQYIIVVHIMIEWIEVIEYIAVNAVIPASPSTVNAYKQVVDKQLESLQKEMLQLTETTQLLSTYLPDQDRPKVLECITRLQNKLEAADRAINAAFQKHLETAKEIVSLKVEYEKLQGSTSKPEDAATEKQQDSTEYLECLRQTQKQLENFKRRQKNLVLQHSECDVPNCENLEQNFHQMEVNAIRSINFAEKQNLRMTEFTLLMENLEHLCQSVKFEPQRPVLVHTLEESQQILQTLKDCICGLQHMIMCGDENASLDESLMDTWSTARNNAQQIKMQLETLEQQLEQTIAKANLLHQILVSSNEWLTDKERLLKSKKGHWSQDMQKHVSFYKDMTEEIKKMAPQVAFMRKLYQEIQLLIWCQSLERDYLVCLKKWEDICELCKTESEHLSEFWNHKKAVESNLNALKLWLEEAEKKINHSERSVDCQMQEELLPKFEEIAILQVEQENKETLFNQVKCGLKKAVDLGIYEESYAKFVLSELKEQWKKQEKRIKDMYQKTWQLLQQTASIDMIQSLSAWLKDMEEQLRAQQLDDIGSFLDMEYLFTHYKILKQLIKIRLEFLKLCIIENKGKENMTDPSDRKSAKVDNYDVVQSEYSHVAAIIEERSEILSHFLALWKKFSETLATLNSWLSVVKSDLEENNKCYSEGQEFVDESLASCEKHMEEVSLKETEKGMINELATKLMELTSSPYLHSEVQALKKSFDDEWITVRSLMNEQHAFLKQKEQEWTSYKKDLEAVEQLLQSNSQCIEQCQKPLSDLGQCKCQVQDVQIAENLLKDKHILLDALQLSSTKLVDACGSQIKLQVESSIKRLQEMWRIQLETCGVLYNEFNKLAGTWETFNSNTAQLNQWITDTEVVILEIKNIQSSEKVTKYQEIMQDLLKWEEQLDQLDSVAEVLNQTSHLSPEAMRTIHTELTSVRSAHSQLKDFVTSQIYLDNQLADEEMQIEQMFNNLSEILDESRKALQIQTDSSDIVSVKKDFSNLQDILKSSYKPESLLWLLKRQILSKNVGDAFVQHLAVLNNRWQKQKSQLLIKFNRLQEILLKEEDFSSKCHSVSSFLHQLQLILLEDIPCSEHAALEKLHQLQMFEVMASSYHLVLESLIEEGLLLAYQIDDTGRNRVLSQLEHLKEQWTFTMQLLQNRITLLSRIMQLWNQFTHSLLVVTQWISSTKAEAETPAYCTTLLSLEKRQKKYQALYDKFGEGQDLLQHLQDARDSLLDVIPHRHRASIDDCTRKVNTDFIGLHKIIEDEVRFINIMWEKWKEIQDHLVQEQSHIAQIKDTLYGDMPDNYSAIETSLERYKKELQVLEDTKADFPPELLSFCKGSFTVIDASWIQVQLLLHQQIKEQVMEQLKSKIRKYSHWLSQYEQFKKGYAEFFSWSEKMMEALNSTTSINLEMAMKMMKKDLKTNINKEEGSFKNVCTSGETLLSYTMSGFMEITEKIKDMKENWQELNAVFLEKLEKLEQLHSHLRMLQAQISEIKEHVEGLEKSFEMQSSQLNSEHLEILCQDIEGCSSSITCAIQDCNSVLSQYEGVTNAEEFVLLLEELESLRKRCEILQSGVEKAKLSIQEERGMCEKLLDDCNQLETWISSNERATRNPKSDASLHTISTTRDELRKFEALQHSVQSSITQLEQINKQYHSLLKECRSELPSHVKIKVKELNIRWDALSAHVSRIVQRLKHTLKVREEFKSLRENMLMWLTEMDLKTTDLEHFSDLSPMDRQHQMEGFLEIFSSQQEKLNILDNMANYLQQRSEPNDAVQICLEVIEIHQYWQEIYERAHLILSKLMSAAEQYALEKEAATKATSYTTGTAAKMLEQDTEDAISPQFEDRLYLSEETTESESEDSISELESVLRETEKQLDATENALQSCDFEDDSNEGNSGLLMMLASCHSNVDVVRHLSYLLEQRHLTDDQANALILRSKAALKKWESIQASASEKEKKVYQMRHKWQHLLADISQTEEWLNAADEEQSKWSLPSEDFKEIVEVIKCLKEFQSWMETKKSLLTSVNESFSNFLTMTNDEERISHLSMRIMDLNQRWNNICLRSASFHRQLQSTLLQSPGFRGTIHDLLLWLEETEKRIQSVILEDSNLDHDLLLIQYNKFLELKDELEQCEPRIAALQQMTSQLFSSTDDSAAKDDDDSNHLSDEMQMIQNQLNSITDRFHVLLLSCEQEAERLNHLIQSDSRKTTSQSERMSRPSSEDKLAPNEETDTSEGSVNRCYRFLARVAWTSLPIQALMLLLLGVASLLPVSEDDFSCVLTNNFARSFDPMLRYPNGPPPM